MRLCAAVLLVWVPVAMAQSSVARDSVQAVPTSTTSDSALSGSQGTVLRTQSTLVLVPALVKTKTGELVFTLTAKDFTVTDDGEVQKVSLEEDAGGQPLALVAVVEVGGDGARHLEQYRRLGMLIEAMTGNVEHRVAVVGFDSEAKVLQGLTPDLTVVAGALGELEAGDSGAAILDGLASAVAMLRKQPVEYRRAILLLSETVDHGSKVKIDDALRELSDTNTIIYSLGFSSSKAVAKREAPKIFGQIKGVTGPAPPGPPGGCMSRDDPNADPTYANGRLTQTWDCLSLLAPPLRIAKIAALMAVDGLQKNVPESVARMSGGEYFKFSDAKSLERGLVAISNHIPNRYVLSFQPQSPHPGLHAVGLKLGEYSDLVVAARSSYWVDGDSGGARTLH